MTADPRPLLTRLPGCSRLGPDALEALTGLARFEDYPAGVTLVREGEPSPDWYCVVESGAVQLSRLDLEADEILDYLTAGDVFDPGAPGQPSACSASATEPTRCLLVPQSAVIKHRGTLSIGSDDPMRGDLTLFVRRVSDLLKGPPATCPRDASVAEAAQLMTRRSVGSVIVLDENGEAVGIVTDRDLRSKVVAHGLGAQTRLDAIMSSPLISTEPDRLAFDALLDMTRRGIHHLAVIEGKRLVGVVSSHDIMLLQDVHPVAVVRDLEGAVSVPALAAVAPRVHGLVRWLAGAGARPFDIGRIVAELNDRLVRRTLALELASLEAEGCGRPPLPFAWLAAGSEGRREQTLKTDQDNALVYQDPPRELEAAAAAYFRRLAEAMGRALVRLGFPVCEGGFMASNPRWCQPDSAWRGYFSSWMQTPQPEQVLRASIFFDLRPIAGDESLGRALWDWVCDRAPAQTLFLRYMAKAALEHHVPLGLFGGFVVERSGAHRDTLDLKARGIFPMTQAMRVYALSLGLRETNTLERLMAAGVHGVFTSEQVDELRDAYEVISRVRLNHQLSCLESGRPPDNFINPESLRKGDRILLKEAFKSLAWLQREVEDRFHTSMIG